MKPLFIVISAPSGAGKTTLCDLLLQSYPEICYSISCTTRAPRITEEDGEDYHFLTTACFQELIAENKFLEYALVHGNYYGTLKDPIYAAMQDGLCILLDIDVAGAAQIRGHLATLPTDDPLVQGFVDIFILPPSLETLRERLYLRATDSEEVVEQRIHNAQEEMQHADEYMFKVVNDDLPTAWRRICDIINTKGELD